MRSVARWLLLLLVIVPLTGGRALEAQAGVCRVRIDSTGGMGRRIQMRRGIHSFGNGGVWTSCIGQNTRMYSDSMAAFSELQRLDLVGTVRFEDGTVLLTSNRATYFLDDQRLEATGDVTLTNLITGSELKGPNLTYLRAVTGVRDSVEIFARGRPTVRYRSFGSAAEDDPYIIVADRLHMLGGSAAWAGGSVTINRADFETVSDSAELDANNEMGILLGNAQIVGGDSADFTLNGQSIAYRTRNDQIEWVQGRDSATAVGDTWRLEGDTVDFSFVDGKVQKAVAWGNATETVASADEYRIVADSIEIDMPDQVLREVRGYRQARATSVTDSLTESDWVMGDTLTAHFGYLGDEDVNNEGAEQAGDGGLSLRFILAIGNAAALYKIETGEPGAPSAINYSRGERILVTFGDDGVDELNVVGQADGVYLEPIGNGS